MKLLQTPYFFAHRALHQPYPQVFCTLPSFACIKRPRWWPVRLNDQHLRSQRKIGEFEQCTVQRSFCKILRFQERNCDGISRNIANRKVCKVWRECGFFMRFGPFFYDKHKAGQDKMFILTLMLKLLTTKRQF